MATKEKLAVFQLELTHVPTEGWYCENAWMGSSLEHAKIMVEHVWNYHNDYEVKWSDGRSVTAGLYSLGYFNLKKGK